MISLRYKTALTTKTVKRETSLGAPDFGGITRRKQQTADWTVRDDSPRTPANLQFLPG